MFRWPNDHHGDMVVTDGKQNVVRELFKVAPSESITVAGNSVTS
jgi:hypothetical protein